MTFVDLLSSVPYLPSATFEAMLEEVPIKLTARLEDPTYRKRRLLADRLGKWEGAREQQRPSGPGRKAEPRRLFSGGSHRSKRVAGA